jgi:hypothetical protein
MNKSGLIGEQLQRQTAKTGTEWTEILERVSETFQTLAQPNLPL